MGENDGMIKGQIQNIPLSLKDWNQNGGAEKVGIEKSG